ncbi:MAG: PIN domain-containing protein [Burkholderiaceae bacterium]|jgi:predicted nucleic acid-binding protein|nr:PIN domain-containing protein [Burkholderiaceae bacterium]
MPVTNSSCFLDSNVLLYLLSGDAAKADRVEQLLKTRPVISVQVLNEVTHVCRRKLGMGWQEIAGFLELVRRLCKVVPLTEAIHDQGRVMAERHRMAFYDACIAAAAAMAGCQTLYSEDMNDGQALEGSLTIRNPFRA